MQISYLDMDYPEVAVSIISDNGGSAHLFQITTGGYTRYRVREQEGGRTTYWQDTSGVVTETKYLGFVPVEVVDIPKAIDYDDPEAAYAYYGHI